MSRGILVIISSPSGAGKTTLARKLMEEFDNLEFSVSYTTRPKRKGETDGKDYWFVKKDRFDDMILGGEFAEWALVHNNYYGTSKKVVDSALAEGRHVVFDVDWQGGRELSKQWPEDALKIFVLPPTIEELEQRLRKRASDSEAVIAARLAKAREELAHFSEYDYLIVNDELERAYGRLRAVYMDRAGLDGETSLVDETTAESVADHAKSLATDPLT